MGKFKITEMYAFIVDDNGVEGVPSITDPFMGTMPLVGADMKRIDDLIPLVKRMSSQYKKEIRLVRFSAMQEVQIFKPE